MGTFTKSTGKHAPWLKSRYLGVRVAFAEKVGFRQAGSINHPKTTISQAQRSMDSPKYSLRKTFTAVPISSHSRQDWYLSVT